MTSPRLDPPLAVDPGPPPPPPASAAPPHVRHETADRFFAWTAGLGIVRGDGWIGGVAAGIAARLRIDPLIVRGILVVVALFGFPALLLYAIAWALLPDLDERIPLRQALRGRFEPAHAGILLFAVVGVIPFGPALVVTTGIPGWMFEPGLGGWPFLSALVVGAGCVVAAGLVFLIVRAARQTPHADDPVAPLPDQRTASAGSDAPESPVTASGSGPDADAAGATRVDADAEETLASASTPAHDVTEPVEPAEPTGSTDDEYAAWRAQHAAWKVQDDAWRRQQQDAARAARDVARRERHAHAAAFTAEAAERRRVRRLSKPRTPFAYVATVLGVAVVAGALVSVTSVESADGLAGALGLFVAAFVVALGMIVAGVARRRSGFLTAMALALLAGGAVAVAVPTLAAQHVLGGGYGISNLADPPVSTAADPFVQPWGNLQVFLAETPHDPAPIYVDKGDGSTMIAFEPGVAVTLDLAVPRYGVQVVDAAGALVELRDMPGASVTELGDGRTRFEVRLAGRETTTEQILVVDQAAGWVGIDLPLTADEMTTLDVGEVE